MTHHKYPELEQARSDMREQHELYRPSHFWDKASSSIVEEIQEYGIEKFRSMNLPLGFFVPTYGLPGNCFSKEMVDGLHSWLKSEFLEAIKPQLSLEQFFSGYASALADYRVFLAADDCRRLPHLHKFSECDAGSPVEQFEFDDRRFSRSSLNYLLGLTMLKKHMPADDIPHTILEIGGGFGTLGEILNSSGISNLRYIDVDIPPTSFVAQWYLQQSAGSENVTTYIETRDLEEINIGDLKPLSVLCAWQIERLRGKVDLFVNFISFQEMEPDIVSNYLSHVERLGTRWILLRNMREGKQKRVEGGSCGVDTAIMSNDYLDMLPSYELVARNVFPFGYKTSDGFHSEILLLRRKSLV